MADLERFKLSNIIYESDKFGYKEFFTHLDNFGSMVRSCASGFYLEDMIDSKLHRSTSKQGSVPSFLLLDPDFAGGAPMIEATNSDAPMQGSEAAGEEEDDNASVNATCVGSAATGSTFTLGVHKIAYKDLPPAALKLDALLYNIFKLSIKGSKQALLQNVSFPSYVQAVIVLVKHMDMSRMSRMGQAFSALDNLTFNGDVHRFQTDFISVKRELDSTQATITHLIMSQLMKTFEGKSKAVQFKIAEDFNKMDVNSPEVNLYDMVQGYCSDLATVGDSKPHMVGVVTCTVCQSNAHESAECPACKQLARELNEAN